MAKNERAPLSLEQIIEAGANDHSVVEIPEWGGHVVVRPITKIEQRRARDKSRTRGGDIDVDTMEREILKAGVVSPPLDDAGVDALGTKEAGIIDRIVQRILVVSGMDEEATARADHQFQD